MAQFEKHFVQDLTQDIKIRQCGTIVFKGDNLSNVITVDLYNGTEPYSGGGSVSCSVICPDGATVPITNGSISGNTVTVTLTGECFALPGQIGVGVQVVSGDIRTTILKAIYNVELLETDTIVDPDSRITASVGQLVSDIENAVAQIPASDMASLMAGIAPTFSASTNYPTGAYVYYNGTLYRFTSAHAAGSWTGNPPTDASAVAICDDVATISNATKEYIYNPELGKKALTSAWVIGGLTPDTGELDTRATSRITTYPYIKSHEQIEIINNKNDLTIISCLYTDDFTLDTRTVHQQGANVTIPSDTYFRLTALINTAPITDVYDLAQYILIDDDVSIAITDIIDDLQDDLTATQTDVENLQDDLQNSTAELQENIDTVQHNLEGFETGKIIINYDVIENSYPDPSSPTGFSPYANWNRSDYIPVTPGQTVYVVNNKYTTDNVWYTSEKVAISKFKMLIRDPVSLVVPDNAAYMVISNDATAFFGDVYTLQDHYVENIDDSLCNTIVNDVTQAISGQDIIFVHITDSHVGTAEMTPERAKEHIKRAMYTAEAVNADFLIHTGDMIQGEGSVTGSNDKQRYNAYMGKIGDFNLPMLWCQGNANHDFGIKTSSDPLTYALNRDIVNSFTGRFGKWLATNAVYNQDDTIHTYYYFDNDFTNYRVIVLDSDDLGGLRRGWGFSQTQIDWFTATLSDAKTKGYPVLVFAHMPPYNGLMSDGIENSGGGAIAAALNAFTANGGIVLAYIYGHVHWDAYYNDSTHGIKYISCTCDLPVATTDTFVPTLGTRVIPQRLIDTASEYAFDVYVINKNTGAIKTFRYGAGSDRTFS